MDKRNLKRQHIRKVIKEFFSKPENIEKIKQSKRLSEDIDRKSKFSENKDVFGNEIYD